MENTMKRHTGFSLLELLVAMAVTLIILAATLSLFETALRTNETSTQMSTLNGNMRSAMNLVVRDLLQAGQGIPTGGVLLPTGTSCQNVNRPVPTQFGGNSPFPYGCANPTFPNLPAVIPGSGFGPVVPNPSGGATAPPLGNPSATELPQFPNSGDPSSDMITMLYQDYNLVTNQVVVSGAPYASPLEQINLNSMTFSNAVMITGKESNGSPVSNPVNIGDLFLVQGGEYFRFVVVTAVNGQTVQFQPGDAFNLNQQPAAVPPAPCNPSGTVCDLQTQVHFGGTCTYNATNPPTWTPVTNAKDCLAFAQRVLMVTYFLDTSLQLNPPNGPIIPRLMRQVNMTSVPADCQLANPPAVGCPSSVAEVIEALEFSYDYTTSTAAPITNQIVTPTGLSDNQIRKVNVFLAGRSDNPLSQTGQYVRNNMATQVDIRSMAFINRYQ
jgi:prepilin-type N-terminal cleavage/methylation domain-containing protein